MGTHRRAKREARRGRSNLGAAFDADALDLTDLFPEVPDDAADSGRLVAVAWGAGLTLREEAVGLRLTCTYRTHWRPGPEQGRTLTYAQVLDLIRAGQRVPSELELVFSPAEATGAWSLDRAERVVFEPGEWRLVGWRHWSENRIGQSVERMFRLGMGVSPVDPFIDLHFRLVPKVQNLGRKRLLGVRAVLAWAVEVRRPPLAPLEVIRKMGAAYSLNDPFKGGDRWRASTCGVDLPIRPASTGHHVPCPHG